MLGLGLAGDALAIDQPDQPRRAVRAAPKGGVPKIALPKTAVSKIAVPKTAVPKTAAPNTATANTSAPNTATPSASAPKPASAVASTGTVKPIAPNNPAALNRPAALSKTNGNAAALNRPAALSKGNGNAAPPNRPAALASPGQHRDNLRAALRTPAEHRRFELAHRQALFEQRARLPFRPFPGERGFTGVPPAGETRYLSNEMVFHVGANVSREAVDNVARRLGLSTAGSQASALTGGTIYRFNVSGGRQMADVVRALEAERIGIAQPNYVFRLIQSTAKDAPGDTTGNTTMDTASDKGASSDTPSDTTNDTTSDTTNDTTLAARSKAPDPSQYVVDKLRLGDVHRVATGSNVLVAVIDSEIELTHPDLVGAIVERFDAVGRADKPHAHGTGMAGAIAARRKLMGIAPEARILAIHAFSPDSGESPQATTQHILAGMEYAIKKGARVINMSFAGPYDPMLQMAMKKARDQGVVLIAAAGNAGPKSPPLYPAADPNVIAVTATDVNDKLFDHANRGPQVAIAAPGVDILEPAPNAGYQLTTGTSVAAAHVSGVAALLIERNPSIDVATVHEILTSSAKTLAPGSLGRNGRDDQFGWGLVDPAQALADLDAKIKRERIAAPAAAPALTPAAARLPVGRAGPISAR
jgi:subtilase family protein